MRVVVNENIKIFHGHVAVRLAAGQEVSGELAALLLERAPTKVSSLGTAPEEDEGGGGVASLAEASTAADVLEWVGEDADRAREALNAEQAADKPRSTLLKQLAKIAEA